MPTPLGPERKVPVRYPSLSDKRVGHTSFLQRADGRPLHLDGAYHGQDLYLVLSGPSLKDEPLHLLEQRGVVTMGVNNSWLMWKPDLWVAVDPPGRFADVGWRDPRILKMCPQSQRNTTIRTQVEGSVVPDTTRVRECPNVGFYVREDDFNPSTFWASTTAQWGTMKEKTDMLGIKASRSVMLVAMKAAHWLGFARVFLVGADFRMSLDEGVSPYAWDEEKDSNGRKSNNNLYRIMNKRFEALRQHGMPMEVWNCTKDSGLLAFPHMPLADAIKSSVSRCDREVVTRGWYRK